MSNLIEPFYTTDRLRDWQLPEPESTEADGHIVRTLEADFREVLRPGGPIWICCDILHLTDDVILQGDTTIIARQIVCWRDTQVIVDRSGGDGGELRILAQEVVNASGEPVRVPVTIVSADESMRNLSYRPSQNRTREFEWVLNDGAEVASWKKRSEADSRWLDEGEPVRDHLNTTFQVATLIWQDRPALCQRQLAWVETLADTSEQTRGLAAQAASFRTVVEATLQDDLLRVPHFGAEVYKTDIEGQLDLLTRREDDWTRYLDKADRLDIWKSTLDAYRESRSNTADLQSRLEEQAEQAREQAQAAYHAAARHVVLSRQEVQNAENRFETQLQIWKEEQQRQASIDVITGAADVLQQIPAAVAAGPEIVAAPIIRDGANFARSVADSRLFEALTNGSDEEDEYGLVRLFREDDDATDTSSSDVDEKTLQKQRQKRIAGLKQAGANAAGGVKKVCEGAQRLIEVNEQAKRMEDQSREALREAKNTTDTALSGEPLTGMDTVTGGSEAWDLLAISIEDVFNEHLMGVKGAVAYRAALKQLVIYGKALCQARIALSEATAQLAEQILRRRSAEQSVKMLVDRSERADAEIEDVQTFAHLLYNRVLETRRSIFLSLESYRRAIAFATLAPADHLPPLPVMTDSVDGFRERTHELVRRERLDALLEKEPQSMRNLSVIFDGEQDAESEVGFLDSLRKYGCARIAIHPDHPDFSGFCRVRLHGIRVYVLGLSCNGPVRVDLTTSGRFMDRRLNGEIMAASRAPYDVTFVYRDTDARDVLVDGDITERYREDFSQITPFTTWSVAISSQHDEDELDLSGATGLEFEFRGEVTSLD